MIFTSCSLRLLLMLFNYLYCKVARSFKSFTPCLRPLNKAAYAMDKHIARIFGHIFRKAKFFGLIKISKFPWVEI